MLAEVTGGDDWEKVRDVLLESSQGVAGEITEERVERAIRNIKKSREKLFANSEKFAIQLSEWRSYGDWRLYFLHRDRLEKVTVEAVQAAAEKYLKTDNRTVGVFLPTKNPDRSTIPETPNLTAALDGYEGREAMAAGEAFDPTPENIDARTETGSIGEHAKYALLSRKTRGNRLTLSGQLHYGSVDSLAGKVAAAKMLPSWMKRGTKTLSFQEYQDRLDELETTLSISGDAGLLRFTMQTKRERLADAMELLRQVLQEPAFDPAQLEILRKEQITSLETQLTEPNAIAGTLLAQTLKPFDRNDVRYERSIQERIDDLRELSAEDIRSLYEMFVGGEHAEVAVVGDFDVDQAKTGLSSLLSEWAVDQPFQHIPQTVVDVEAETIKVNTPDKQNAIYIAALRKPINDADPDYEALLIGNWLFGSLGEWANRCSLRSFGKSSRKPRPALAWRSGSTPTATSGRRATSKQPSRRTWTGLRSRSTECGATCSSTIEWEQTSTASLARCATWMLPSVARVGRSLKFASTWCSTRSSTTTQRSSWRSCDSSRSRSW